jgi:hypothetical protein
VTFPGPFVEAHWVSLFETPEESVVDSLDPGQILFVREGGAS